MAAFAGPKELRDELNRAIAERGLKPAMFHFRTEITADPPESYRIQSGLITGGDLRGLMYGYLDAAAQIRARGRVLSSKGSPATRIRGIRYFLHNEDLEKDWYYSRDYWTDYICMLARNRFNRFNLCSRTRPTTLRRPIRSWLALPEFSEVRVPGSATSIANAIRDAALHPQTAAEHGIDFTLGIWEHNVQTNQKPTVIGLTNKNSAPTATPRSRRCWPPAPPSAACRCARIPNPASPTTGRWSSTASGFGRPSAKPAVS
jgi:hypothetical protein